MKYLLIVMSFLIMQLASAQAIMKVDEIQFKGKKNIEVVKLHSDSLSTSFHITIKDSVKKHKHVFHSETIYVLSGKGIMEIGDNTYEVQKGDLFNIPMKTPHSLKVTSDSPMKVLSFQTPEFKGSDRVFLE